MDIDISIPDAEQFLTQHDATTNTMLEDVAAIQGAFRHFCAAWRDAGRERFEEELAQFASQLTQALEELEQDKAFLRRVIECARAVEEGGRRQAFE